MSVFSTNYETSTGATDGVPPDFANQSKSVTRPVLRSYVMDSAITDTLSAGWIVALDISETTAEGRATVVTKPVTANLNRLVGVLAPSAEGKTGGDIVMSSPSTSTRRASSSSVRTPVVPTPPVTSSALRTTVGSRSPTRLAFALALLPTPTTRPTPVWNATSVRISTPSRRDEIANLLWSGAIPARSHCGRGSYERNPMAGKHVR